MVCVHMQNLNFISVVGVTIHRWFQLLIEHGSKTAGYWSLSSLNMAYIYDELTIKERQKKDSEFSSILNSVRCGFPTDETILILKVTDDNL